jgi:predicted negative regulator of RcsB-dependent stress response
MGSGRDLCYFMVDFFAENEDHIAQHKSFWRHNGEAYFLMGIGDAVRMGWRWAASKLRAQRDRAGFS